MYSFSISLKSKNVSIHSIIGTNSVDKRLQGVAFVCGFPIYPLQKVYKFPFPSLTSNNKPLQVSYR